MDDLYKTFVKTLKESGLRLTATRTAICKLLAESDDHPNALEIHTRLKEQYPSLSLATVYNTLDVLVKMGLVNVLGCVGGGHLHYDPNAHPHINLMCVKCHSIVDIDSAEVSELDKRISRESGFQLQGSSILYYGLCPACQIGQHKS